ncbi:MAG: hypothetical protein HDT36_02210 [Clostridiales bacterium]|nr:hypothetical protein [Clostridiales bacterium]
MIDSMIGYALSNDGATVSLSYSKEMIEVCGNGFQFMTVVSNDTDETFFYLYFYDTAENASNGYNIIKNFIEGEKDYYDYEWKIKMISPNIVLSGNSDELLNTVKNSTIPNDVLTDKQIDFVKSNTHNLFSELTTLPNESYDCISLGLYRNRENHNWRFLTLLYCDDYKNKMESQLIINPNEEELAYYLDVRESIKNDDDMHFSQNSYVNIEDNVIYVSYSEYALNN